MAFSKSAYYRKYRNRPVICWVNLRVSFVNWSKLEHLEVSNFIVCYPLVLLTFWLKEQGWKFCVRSTMGQLDFEDIVKA